MAGVFGKLTKYIGRSEDEEFSRCYHKFGGNRINYHHLSLAKEEIYLVSQTT